MAALTHSSEMKIFWQSFHRWDAVQRRAFLERLVPKVTPHKLFAMTARLLSSAAAPERWEDCKTFEEQVAYFHCCLDRWTADEANAFLRGLEEIDERAMNEFYTKVASTVQEP